MNLQICNNYGRHANIYYEIGGVCPVCLLLDKFIDLENRIIKTDQQLQHESAKSYAHHNDFMKIEKFIKQIHPEIDY